MVCLRRLAQPWPCYTRGQRFRSCRAGTIRLPIQRCRQHRCAFMATEGSKQALQEGAHRNEQHGQVCGGGRVSGLTHSQQVQLVPAVLLDCEGPMQLHLQGVVSPQLDVLAGRLIRAVQPDLQTCASPPGLAMMGPWSGTVELALCIRSGSCMTHAGSSEIWQTRMHLHGQSVWYNVRGLCASPSGSKSTVATSMVICNQAVLVELL